MAKITLLLLVCTLQIDLPPEEWDRLVDLGIDATFDNPPRPFPEDPFFKEFNQKGTFFHKWMELAQLRPPRQVHQD